MTLAEILEHLVPEDGPLATPCLRWLGGHSDGYAVVRYLGKMRNVHKVMFDHNIEPIPDATGPRSRFTLDHLCRNRWCANWLHLERVTRGENVLRGVGWSGRKARQVTCLRGHELVRQANGHRQCLTCANERRRAKYRERSGEVAWRLRRQGRAQEMSR